MQQSSLVAWLKKPATISKKVSNTAASSRPPSLETRPPSLETTKHSILANPLCFSDDDNPVIKASSPKAPPQANYANRLPSLPPNVTLRACTHQDLPALKRLNSLLLPIPYPASFYREIVEDPLINGITLLAFWREQQDDDKKDSRGDVASKEGKLVGAIRCRILPPAELYSSSSASSPRASSMAHSTHGPKSILYISTLVLLSPFRSHGIATHLLHNVLQHAMRTHGVGSVGAHVWEKNEEGLEWYRRRGFKEMAKEREYYRRLSPGGAVVVKKEVGVRDLLVLQEIG